MGEGADEQTSDGRVTSSSTLCAIVFSSSLSRLIDFLVIPSNSPPCSADGPPSGGCSIRQKGRRIPSDVESSESSDGGGRLPSGLRSGLPPGAGRRAGGSRSLPARHQRILGVSRVSGTFNFQFLALTTKLLGQKSKRVKEETLFSLSNTVVNRPKKKKKRNTTRARPSSSSSLDAPAFPP